MRIALRSQLLIDGTGQEPIRNGVVVVDGSRIADIGPVSQVSIPSDAQMIDCSKGTLLPGLVDSHIHVALDSTIEESVTQQHSRPESVKALRAYMSLKKDLEAGVTTVRALGDGSDVDKQVRDAIARGEIDGPRVLAAVQAIRPSHGTSLNTAVSADGVDEVRRCTRKAISQGADVIKLFVSNVCIGQTHLDYLRGDLTQVPAFTKDEIQVAVEEAHRVGIKVAAHAIGGPALRWALEAGVDSIEHANLIEEQDIDLFLRSGAYLSDPNLHLFFDKDIGFESEGNRTHRWSDLPTWWHEKVRRAREQTRTVQAKALRAGVKFALATDLNHGGLWKEAKYFVEVLGATEMQAILAVTLNGAELCGLADRVGTLEKRKYADIICVDGNPLDQIERLRNVRLVMKEGKLVRRDL